MPGPASRFRVFLPLFAVALLSDCASKRAAVDALSPSAVPHPVVGDLFRFTLAFNTRGAMGLSAGAQTRWVLAILALVIVTGIAVWLVRTRTADRLTLAGLALVAAGALGNMADRVRWERGVVDFIDVGLGDTRFYIFNVADCWITIGAVLLWFAMRKHDTGARHAS